MEFATFPKVSSFYNPKLVPYKPMESSDLWFSFFATTPASNNLLQMTFDKYAYLNMQSQMTLGSPLLYY